MQLKEIGEFQLIERIKRIISPAPTNVILEIGDDAAVFKPTKNKLNLLTTDAFVEGVHFDFNHISFYQLGWRLLAANLSDIAAMAGEPKYAVLSLALPSTISIESVEEFYKGMTALGDQFQISIIGGDTSLSPDRTFISLTLFGEAKVSHLSERSGAEVGDNIFVTGFLGCSEAGLRLLQTNDPNHVMDFSYVIDRHCVPNPRINEAKFLVENFNVNSMIDISDGLSSDLRHICNRSGVGVKIYADQIPIHSVTKEVANRFSETPLSFALHGGEDFELLFTSPDIERSIGDAFQKRFGLPCTKIGVITRAEDELVVIDSEGRSSPLKTKGFDHFRQ